VIGRAKFNVFAVRAEELTEGRPELVAAIGPLLEARNAVEQQVSELDRKVMKLARHDAQVRRFMTVPGVGPITALAFKATIDDPARFARSRSVGAYVGLTSRRDASGEGGSQCACVCRVGYSAGLICTGITRGLTNVVRVKASAIAATSAPSSGSC
jgi:transposase